ncbi:MAG: glycine zipper 2TM domain-containing protein [Polaromonas sp.]|uniref:glycine zipper 2TM domain-containing protein n=1 Tax=Polaromonas sp. TaxID=1869339 RepID=UPI00272EEA31|nr:glycine zipper 2TM domain-containing protein [Polaromonas sp.]MDP2257564.1 glycine zipper 2TM domain-containing protein [Polaromonas sp.]
MTTSIDTLQPGQQPASSGNKPLWAAVAILGVAVLGMGATLIYNQRTPAPVATVAALTAPQAATPSQLAAPAASTRVADDLIEKPAAAPAKPAPAPVRKVVRPVPHPAPAPGYSGVSPAPHYAPAPVVAAAPVCAVCGSVESVTAVERSGKPAGPGLGTVAGGVLGAVLGNQVGRGNGRTAATILGAVGGGFAGNAIEGNMRKETVYQVDVRMEDGSRRTVEVARAPSVGSRVTLEGATLRTSDGATYGPKPLPAPVAAQPTFSPDYQGR